MKNRGVQEVLKMLKKRKTEIKINVSMIKYIGFVFLLLLGFFPALSSAVSNNVVSNPGFESGTSPWVFYTNGAGSFLNDASGDGSLHSGHIKIAKQGTNVQLYQAGMVLEADTLYQLGFKAYSNTGRNITVSIQKHDSPYTSYGISKYAVKLGTSWSGYSIQFKTSGFSGTINDGRLLFWLADTDAPGDQLYFDDVILAKVSSKPPTIITHPSNQTVDVGQTAKFTVAVTTASMPVSYQWQKDDVDIPGANSATYTTLPLALSDSGSTFRVRVTNSTGSVMSNKATLTVLPGTSLNLIKNPGFESGITPWVFYTNGAGKFLDDGTGAASPSSGHITISSSGSNVQLYQADIKLEPDTTYKLSFKAYSNTGHDLSVSIQKHSSPFTSYGLSKYAVNLGTSWSEYSIQFKTSGFSAPVNDARMLFWLADSDASGDHYYFDDVILSKILSGPVPPTIITHPSSKTVGSGQTATFSVSASGTTPLYYQWQKNSVNISGAKGETYTTPATTSANNGDKFRVIVSNAYGKVTSNEAILTVTSTPANKQLVLLDVIHTHTTNITLVKLLRTDTSGKTYTKSGQGFSKFNFAPDFPTGSLVSPVNYAAGTLYQRIQVFTKPSSNPVQYQICVFQDQIISSKHVCSSSSKLTFIKTGTYYASQSMTSMFQYNNINWERELLVAMTVVKDKNGNPVDNTYSQFVGKWYGSPDLSLYYPMKVHYTAIIVPPGGGEPIWPD